MGLDENEMFMWPRHLAVRRQRRLAWSILGTLSLAVVHFFPAPGVVRAQSESSRPVEPCAGCHQDISNTCRRTGMAQSFCRPSPANTIEDYTNKNTFYHKASDSYFTMLRRDGKCYQRRCQVDFNGKPVNVMEKQIDFIMGSGNHSRAYLHRTSRNRKFPKNAWTKKRVED